jgi:hypothetical protein
MHPIVFLHPLHVPLRKAKVVRVLNAQPTGWLAKHAAKCLRRTLLDDLGFRKVSCLTCRVVVIWDIY